MGQISESKVGAIDDYCRELEGMMVFCNDLLLYMGDISLVSS